MPSRVRLGNGICMVKRRSRVDRREAGKQLQSGREAGKPRAGQVVHGAGFCEHKDGARQCKRVSVAGVWLTLS